MARIRHIALTTKDPEKTAAFYMQAFDMQEASRSPNGSLHLTDGYIDLAILHWKLTITHIACLRVWPRASPRPATSNHASHATRSARQAFRPSDD